MTFIILRKILDHAFRKRLHRFSGRNYLGRICVFHKGGGRLRLYRPLDIYRRLHVFGRIVRIQRDTYRTAFVALVLYENGLLSSILAVEGLRLGDLVFSGTFWPLERSEKLADVGSAMPLSFVNPFSSICSVEIRPFCGMQLFRSAGVNSLVVSKSSVSATLKGPSGWLMRVSAKCLATIGRVSNSGHRFFRVPSAGYNRNRGIRPTVRGVVKNPCDHPHGGGEGKGSPPAAQLTPWSRLTKGTPTTAKKWARQRRRLFKTLT